MKRFFLVFSILMIVFLLLTAGSLVVVRYASVQYYDLSPTFLGGWSVTAIPYSGAGLVYPQGDLYIVRRVPEVDIKIGDVILYFTADRSAILPGCVTGQEGGSLLVLGSDGKHVAVPGVDALCRYESRMPGFVSLLDALCSWISICLFAVVLAASILLWRLLPSRKKEFSSLSRSDGDISSNLY